MKILLAGDSTVANCPTEEYPMSGWGAELPPHVFTRAAVHNFAKGGASTESFREEGLWGKLLKITETGDAVLLQFGHNDQKLSHLGAATGYTSNLKQMISEARERGARVVLCTSVERRNFVSGAQQATLADYAEAVRVLAEEAQLPLIDLSAWTTELYETAGEAGSTEYFTHLVPGEHGHWPEGLQDNTHFNRVGAATIAEYVAQELGHILP